MYSPTTRLLTILELLQAHPRLGGAELARRLEVDRRSIRRYVVMLQDLGIPIEATRGPAGGYRLRPGYKLPPLMFSDEEAVALTLALHALPRTGLAVAPEAAAGALAKLERVLPAALRERVQAVQAGVALDPSALGAPVDGALVAMLGEAARCGRRVRLRYRSGDGAETERVVDPYGVVNLARSWYLAGYCHLRGGPRTFRLDRIVAAEPRDEPFVPPQGFDVVGYVQRAMTAIPGRWAVEVVLGVTADEARRRIPATYGTVEPIAEGVIFRCRHDDLDDLARWLVGLGAPFVIRHPPELREALRRLATEIAKMADQISFSA